MTDRAQTELTFEALRNANRMRLPHFKNRNGKPVHSVADGSDWNIAEWTNALAGEVGEACNIAKKIMRGDFDGDQELGIGMLMDELADVVCYADLVAQRSGRQLGIAVRNKFNEVSERVKSEVKL